MAFILGQIRSKLTPTPFLRVSPNLKFFGDVYLLHSWDHQVFIHKTLKMQIWFLKPLVPEENGGPFWYNLTDVYAQKALIKAGVGLYLTSEEKWHNFWQNNQVWHINLKQLLAEKDTIVVLTKPGESAIFQGDNQIADNYLKSKDG